MTTEEINAIGYKGAGAVAGCAFFLVKYEKGVMTPVSKKVMSSAFLAECTVELTATSVQKLSDTLEVAAEQIIPFSAKERIGQDELWRAIKQAAGVEGPGTNDMAKTG